jgi:DNA-binding transcriptional ArsR family regulator
MEVTHRMTNARFDAPASKTPARHGGRFRHTERGSVAFRLVRVIWLTAIFARRESVTIADYRRRFGVSLRSFRRDLALLREAGFYLETATAGHYRMVCFARDYDGV